MTLPAGTRLGPYEVVAPLGAADRAGLSHIRNVLITADGSAYVYQYRRWLSDLYVVEGLK